jgi:hypothetical protein
LVFIYRNNTLNVNFSKRSLPAKILIRSPQIVNRGHETRGEAEADMEQKRTQVPQKPAKARN